MCNGDNALCWETWDLRLLPPACCNRKSNKLHYTIILLSKAPKTGILLVFSIILKAQPPKRFLNKPLPQTRSRSSAWLIQAKISASRVTQCNACIIVWGSLKNIKIVETREEVYLKLFFATFSKNRIIDRTKGWSLMTWYYVSKNWQFHFSTCHKRSLFGGTYTTLYTFAQKPSHTLLLELKMNRYWLIKDHKI